MDFVVAFVLVGYAIFLISVGVGIGGANKPAKGKHRKN